MTTAALDGVGRDADIADARRGFPWAIFALVWIGFSAVLLVRFWHQIVTLDFSDADDLMRLMEVRDLLDGQSWFDLTQYRLDPPFGLQSHWSRLVDMPLAASIVALTPLLGRATAEMVTVAVIPLVTLGVTMAALVAGVRRTIGTEALFLLLVPAVMITSPAILAQMFPTRIDHHGWQIAMGTIALMGLLDPRATRSGWIAGSAVALQASISLEALPYAVGVAGSLALLWIAGREQSQRLVAFMAALAAMSLASFVATAPTLRWSTDLCDVVKPAHLATFAVAAAAVAIAVWATAGRGIVARIVALGFAALIAGGTFALTAPNCLAGPFGDMDPLVRRLWYDNVLEGVGVMSQPLSGAATMIVFPLIGLAGAFVALARADDREAQRRWLLILLIGLTTFVAGMAVRRAAGLSHIAAIPGVFALFDIARRRIETIGSPVRRVPLTVLVVALLSPAFPVAVAAMISPDEPVLARTPATPGGCGGRCDIAAIGRLPAATFFTEVDDSPRLIGLTHHTAYAAGYHRLQQPIHDVIAAFTGSDEVARRLICGKRFGYLMISPDSGETHIYRRAAPGGFIDHLVRGETPPWLTSIPLPAGQLRLYRIEHDSSCHG